MTCTATYDYTDPHNTFTGALRCDGVDHKNGLHSGPVGDGYRHVWPMREQAAPDFPRFKTAHLLNPDIRAGYEAARRRAEEVDHG